LSAAEAAALQRPLIASSGTIRGRPIGLSLQQRAACDAIAERLSAPVARPTAPIRISAAPRMGLRTLRTILARQARVEGYVPVCP
jgi:hypothetical protein